MRSRPAKSVSRSFRLARRSARQLPAVRSDSFHAAHIRMKRGGNLDGSVLLLVVLQDRDQRAADGQAGPIQRVDELGLSGALVAELDVRAAGLERLRITAGRDLAIGILAGEPHLDVVGL